VKLFNRNILLYGLAGGILIVLMRVVEYRYLILEHSLEIYGGLTALIFTVLGIYFGNKLTRPKEVIVLKEVTTPGAPFTVNEAKRTELGITHREIEILELISKGLSNREIADALFVSENTIKTHSSNLFLKLNAKRRTQAVQIAKETGLLP
jgi:DNA-binding CsgD family transcriptional regulator